MRTIEQIDADIDAIHDELRARYPQLNRVPRLHYGPAYLAACRRWGRAWDRHPDLRARQDALYLERHEAQLERDRKEAREAKARDRREAAAYRTAAAAERSARFIAELDAVDQMTEPQLRAVVAQLASRTDFLGVVASVTANLHR